MIDVLMGFWALISIAVTLALLVVIPWLILRKYVHIALNIVKDTVPPLSMGPRDFIRLEGKVVEFRAFDGLRLQGMFLYCDPGICSRGMIVFAHEFKSDMYSAARYCQGLLNAGFDVFSFDFRNHGGSAYEENYNPLQWCSDHELNDILGAIAYVEDWLEKEGRPREIGLFGISRGGAAAIIAAWRHPEIKAVVTDGAFSTDKVIEHFMKRWAGIFAKIRFVYENHPPTFWRFLRWMLFAECRRSLGVRFPSVRKALLDLDGTPILIIHGEKDGYIPVDQARMLYAVSTEPKYLWVVPNAKHNQSAIVTPIEYAERLVSFFDEHLLGPIAAPKARQHASSSAASRPQSLMNGSSTSAEVDSGAR
jgi:pimeloyl-ACP methyl ester carboxylesterase